MLDWVKYKETWCCLWLLHERL